jgi:large subunit ribosomal protein L23
MRADTIIIKPLITEKSSEMATKKVYAFQVNLDANKFQVAEIVEKMYNVEVAQVRVTTRKGKVKRVGRKMVSKQQPSKKIAYVMLKKGTLNLFPNM